MGENGKKVFICSRQVSNPGPLGCEPSMLPQDQRGFDDRLTKDSYYEVHWREIQIRNKELTKGCILMGKFFLKVFKLQVKNSSYEFWIIVKFFDIFKSEIPQNQNQ